MSAQNNAQNQTNTAHPTPYSDINETLQILLSGVQSILKDNFVGMYLYGSLALGDFDLQKSDIDFLVVTNDVIPAEMIPALDAMHARMTNSNLEWAKKIEGSYIPRQALRRYDPKNTRHPRFDIGERLSIQQHDQDWVIQYHILHKYGVVVVGPDPKTLADPVPTNALKQAVLDILHGWWEPMLDDPAPLLHRGYQAYTTLTMCRVLYTLEYGIVISKPKAARWAQKTLDERWAALIEKALVWQRDTEFNHLPETQDFIRYTLERGK